jgi:hypothetical protein
MAHSHSMGIVLAHIAIHCDTLSHPFLELYNQTAPGDKFHRPVLSNRRCLDAL